jgi:hypothetical protein
MLLKSVILHSSINVPVHHVWVKVNKKIKKVNPRKGDTISFNATVKEYHRKEGCLDYCFGHINSIECIIPGQGKDLRAYCDAIKGSGRLVAAWAHMAFGEAQICTV